MIKNFLLVGLGGSIGSMLRYAVTCIIATTSYPSTLSTFIVNCVGSFLIGLLGSIISKDSTLLLCTVGFCGGFTTYSTFSSQSLQLLQCGKYSTAALYILGTLVLCLLFTALGIWLGESVRIKN